MKLPITTRFAPSPTGNLHLGHAYSALLAFDRVGDQDIFLLRMEDIDQGRCRDEFETAIIEDLQWLGLRWPQPVRRQSEHMADYSKAVNRLAGEGLLYHCFCSRKDIKTQRSKLGITKQGPDGPLYPGSCRSLDPAQKKEFLEQKTPFALRLDLQKALARVGKLTWVDELQGEIIASPEIFGDVVIARKDTPTSYHLSVSLDDHLQGINHIIRGQDLFQATHIHRLLQALLDLSTPRYHHHRLLLDEDGQKFAKRNRSLTLKELRQNGILPERIRSLVGLGNQV